jgi:hypothetical protein
MSIGIKAKMEKNPVEGGPFRMPQPIEPCHSRDGDLQNRPKRGKKVEKMR